MNARTAISAATTPPTSQRTISAPNHADALCGSGRPGTTTAQPAIFSIHVRSARQNAGVPARRHARKEVSMDTQISWPRKTREMHSHHFDSTVWNDFQFRDDDIVIATFGKSGTTWSEEIVGQLIFKGAEEVAVAQLSPWLDLRFPPKEVKFAGLEAQSHRRFIKTH